MADRILHVYTISFPYGKGENFLETELLYLSESFDKIYIHPWMKKEGSMFSIPSNAVIENIQYQNGMNLWNRLLMVFPYLLKPSFLREIKYQFAFSGQLLRRAEALNDYLEDKDGLHYSYWLSDWATVLGLVKRERPSLIYVSRAHRFDVYDEGQKHGFHPYRDIQLKGLESLFPISQYAQSYLTSRNPGLKSEVQFLGTEDMGLNPMIETDTLRVISCSTVIPLKRVSSIPDVLERLGRPVQWIHIGDGSEIENLKMRVDKLPSHIQAELKGYLKPVEVMAIYKEQHFDLFLHLSSSEGIPVSMMEAISFGVPIVAVDVECVNEIVTSETGYLLEENGNADIWADEVKAILEKLSVTPKREGVRRFWEQNFQAKLNYSAFAKKLENLWKHKS